MKNTKKHRQILFQKLEEWCLEEKLKFCPLPALTNNIPSENAVEVCPERILKRPENESRRMELQEHNICWLIGYMSGQRHVNQLQV